MNHPESPPTLARALAIGTVGFGLVSSGVFATVAFGERWMYTHLGLLGAYLAWTALFILAGGAVLGSLVAGVAPSKRAVSGRFGVTSVTRPRRLSRRRCSPESPIAAPTQSVTRISAGRTSIRW